MKAKLIMMSMLGGICGFTACQETSKRAQQSAAEQADKTAIIQHYSKLVHLTYTDCLHTAKELDNAISIFLSNPTQTSLNKAKEAWLVSREPYGQSEAFRFYAGPIDDEKGPEGLLNAWPLDEAYIESSSATVKGIIDNTADYPELSQELLISLNEQEGEENISMGYHAIEFLLWGIDQSAEGPGERPFTDYTTAPNAKRRAQYLKLATKQLIDNLQFLVNEWAPEKENYRAKFNSLPEDQALTNILNGIGMLSGFELARERVDVPLNTMSQEDEHSCFSDNTHNDILYNAQSVQNAFEGSYKGVSVELAAGPSVKQLFDNAENLSRAIQKSVNLSKSLNAPFDQLILKENTEGRASVKAIVDSLSEQANAISAACSNIGLSINIEE